MSVPSGAWRVALLIVGVSCLALLAIAPRPGFGGSSPRPGAPDTAIGDDPTSGVPASGALATSLGTQDDHGMVVVPAGDFVLGGDLLTGTGPGQVVFAAEFLIDRTEVTNAAFADFVLQTGYRTVAEQRGDPRTWRTYTQPNLATNPVVSIAWADAIAFCDHAGKRLPSEVEWEKAARGSDARLWPWGNEWEDLRANTMERGQVGTTSVGAFPLGASPYGLVDMAGNAWEWTASAYTADAMSDSTNSIDEGSFRDHRVLRGGSWRTIALGTQSTYRKPAPSDYRRDTTGFRCAGSTTPTPRRWPRSPASPEVVEAAREQLVVGALP